MSSLERAEGRSTLGEIQGGGYSLCAALFLSLTGEVRLLELRDAGTTYRRQGLRDLTGVSVWMDDEDTCLRAPRRRCTRGRRNHRSLGS